MEVIRTESLVKRFGTREILRGIDLSVTAGTVYGFLGPNGAGKTTTIRILIGLLRATGGTVRVFGLDPWADGPKLRRDIGYLAGDVALYPQITGRAFLTFCDRARRQDSSREIARLSDVFRLPLNDKVRRYSRGMKQKLGLIQALAHKPRLLILDEPTTALDPLMREALLNELRAAARDGRTVLFSSHTLSEVEQLCNWVGIVREGRLIEQQSVAHLRKKALRRVELALKDGAALSSEPPASMAVLNSNPKRWTGTWAGPVTPLLDWLSQQPCHDVLIAPPDLEDLFLAYYDDDTASSEST